MGRRLERVTALDRTTAVERRSTPSARADRQEPLQYFGSLPVFLRVRSFLHCAAAELRPQRHSTRGMENAAAGKAAGKTVCFDCSKREIFTPSSGLKVLRRRLQTTYKVTA